MEEAGGQEGQPEDDGDGAELSPVSRKLGDVAPDQPRRDPGATTYTTSCAPGSYSSLLFRREPALALDFRIPARKTK